MKKKSNKNTLYYVLILIVFIGGAFFWVSDIESDPPMHYSGLGQSLSTDPHHYVFHARNKVLYDDFDPYNYSRWTVFQHSLVSLTSYLTFNISAVSLKNANLVGIVLNLTSLIFLILGMLRHHRPVLVAAFSLCYLLNITLIIHARLPYLENGLLFFTSILFYLYSRWESKLWTVVIYGILIAFATFTGKLFGALLLPVVVLAIYFSGANNRIRKIISVTLSFMVSSVLLIAILYGKDYSIAFGYMSEQSYGLRGFPDGLTSPWNFFEHLISYGYVNRLFHFNLDLVVIMLGGSSLLTYFFIAGKKLSGFSPVLRFSIFWIAIVFLGLMPLNYSPMRYSLFLLPAIFIFFFSISDHAFSLKKIKEWHLSYVNFVIVLLLLWLTLFHTVAKIFFDADVPIRILTWSTLPAAIVIVYLLRVLINKYRFGLANKWLIIFLLAIIFFSTGSNISYIKEKLLSLRHINSIEANYDLDKILTPGAVISGPYAPLITTGNSHKSFIYQFGLTDIVSSLFDKQPITHLALDRSNHEAAISKFPELKGIKPVSVYWIRGYEVTLYNISKVYNNPLANQYQMSSYEEAAEFINNGIADSAYIKLTDFIQSKGNSRSADLMLVDLLYEKGEYRKMITAITTLASRYPTDFYINLHCGQLTQIVGLLSKDGYLISIAKKYYNQATIIDPYKIEMANQLYLQTLQQFQNSNNTQRP